MFQNAPTSFLLHVILLTLWFFGFQELPALEITNDVYRAYTLTNTEVVVTGKSELHLTGNGNPVSGSTIRLNSTDAWLFFANIPPSTVESTLLVNVKVNEATAIRDTNVRVVQFGQGTVVIPHSPDFPALELFYGKHFTGRRKTLECYRAPEADSLGGIRSVRLKRGYMATLARNANGTGTSRCYVAQDVDLDISLLPSGLDGNVNFVRVFPWRWVAKKGIAGNIESGLDVKWTYNWNLNRNSPLDWEYVPIRQSRWWPGLDQDWKVRGATHLLGYNEPDRPDQANLTVAEAISSWPDLLATGLRVGAPAVSDGGLSWLYNFIDQADAAGLRVDYVPIHYYRSYSSPSNASGAATQMYDFLKTVYDRVKRPLWVTEWNNGANWTSDPDPTYAQQASAVAAMTDMLDNAPFVERYAIYNWVEDVRRVKWDDGSLTSAGVVYRDNVSPVAYVQEMPDSGGAAVAKYGFDGSLRDETGNGHEASAIGTPSFTAGKSGQCLILDGTDDCLRLPQKLGDSTDFSFAAWVKWNGGGNWQRIFDLGNGDSDFIYLTPKSSAGQLRFNIRKGGTDQQLSAASPPVGTWTHVAVTLGGSTGRIYINGVLAATSTSMSYNPVDLNTRFNYIGRGQFDADPYFGGCIDDARFFSTELSAAQVAAIAGDTSPPQFVQTPLPSADAVKHHPFTNRIQATGTPVFSKIAGPAWLSVAPDGYVSGVPDDGDEGLNRFLIAATNPNGATDTDWFDVGVTEPDDLVARYGFDNTPSASAGTADGTTAGSPAYVTGKRGNALFFDGVDDHVVLPAGTASHDAITLAAWVLWNGSGNWQRIFDFGNGQDEHLFLTPKSDSGKLRFSIENRNAPQFIESSSALPSGVWVHAAATLGGGMAKLYVNGALVASGAMTWKPSDFAPSLNYIGKSRFSSDPFFSGRIDEAMIFSRVLTAAEITNLGASRPPIFTANPLSLPTASPGVPYARSVATSASDPDAGDTISFVKISGPSWLSVASNGRISGIPSIADAGTNHFIIRATDSGLVSTDAIVAITVTEPQETLAHLEFDGGTQDLTGTAHGTVNGGTPTYERAIFDKALKLDGTDDCVTLPPGFLNGVNDLTICARVRWNGGGAWQRIFDFGNNTNQFLCLTPLSGNVNYGLRFTIKNNGGEQQLNYSAPLPTGEWCHVAVTLSGNTGTLYLNGAAVDTRTITIDPADFSPALNYLGKSLFSADPYLNGSVDDLRVFKRALTSTEVAALAIPEQAVAVPDQGYVEWASGISFPAGGDAPGGDPDGDGSVNLLEWLFGTDPLRSASSFLPDGSVQVVPSLDAGKRWLCLEARVRKSRPGVSLVPQAAAALAELGSVNASAHAHPLGSPVDDGDFEILTWYYDVPVGDAPHGRGFMRLKVTDGE